MAEKNLQELFCEKISLELERFKQKAEKLPQDEIMENVYRIACMNNIHKLLMEMSGKLPMAILRFLLVFPDLLQFLYYVWIKKDDFFYQELGEWLQECVTNLAGDQEEAA